MSKKIFLLFIFVFMSSYAWAVNPWLGIKAENGIVITYLPSSSYYMPSRTRLFDREQGTTINCYESGMEITMNAVPDDGYVFDYWTGTIPLEGNQPKFVFNGDTNFVAHFKQKETIIECPEIEPCPDCPDCNCPEIEPCTDCNCPEIEPCTDCNCPECPDCETDEGLCFINSLN